MTLDRRTFLEAATSCAGHLALMSWGAGPGATNAFASRPRGRVVSSEIWGRLEEVGPGLWALISTPLAGDRESGAWRTLSNGGIIAGEDEVLLVEACATVQGARWLAGEARRLTGREPTLAVVTHFHGDHCGGIAGYRGRAQPIEVRSTARTRELLGEQDPLPKPVLPKTGNAVTLDLGGRTVQISSREGHTPSDVSISIDDPRVVWCGDLVWNGMFPNYTHATPSKKAESVRSLLVAEDAIYVPGHGDLAQRGDLDRYLELLDDVELHARRAIEAGEAIEEAAAAYRIPDHLGEWTMFSPRYYRVAFEAWRREITAP